MRKAPFLYLSAFLMDGGLALASLCIPLLAIRVGGTYDDLGALRATHSLTYALGAFWLGRLADRSTRGAVLGAGVCAVLVSSPLLDMSVVDGELLTLPAVLGALVLTEVATTAGSAGNLTAALSFRLVSLAPLARPRRPLWPPAPWGWPGPW